MKQLKLKGLRVSRDMTQETMAKALGITLESYCRKERGHQKFSLEEAYTLAKIFSTTVEELFFKD